MSSYKDDYEKDDSQGFEKFKGNKKHGDKFFRKKLKPRDKIRNNKKNRF